LRQLCESERGNVLTHFTAYYLQYTELVAIDRTDYETQLFCGVSLKVPSSHSLLDEKHYLVVVTTSTAAGRVVVLIIMVCHCRATILV
jgi:hypothetical protein